jgi:hypothetical protein
MGRRKVIDEEEGRKEQMRKMRKHASKNRFLT